MGAFDRSGGVPASLYAVGAGATVALQAAGNVLIYRTNRIINLARIQMGTFTGWPFVNLRSHRTITLNVNGGSLL